MTEDKREEVFFENLAEEWLAEWRNLDFSWDGLSQAEWAIGPRDSDNPKCWRAPLNFPGHGKMVGQGDHAYIQASLQDYWRWSYGLSSFGEFENLDDQPILLSDDDLLEAGLLTEWNGRLWHIAHLPQTDLKNTIPQHERGVLELAKLLKQRILLSRAYDGGADHRLQLVGTRARNLHVLWNQMDAMGNTPEDRTVYLRSQHSEFKDFVAQDVRLGRGSTIETTLFVEPANFQRAVIEENVTLDHSRFLASADFYKARLSRGISFQDVVFRGAANFEHSELGWGASFKTARFKEKADFSHASFGGYADFFGCHFLSESDFRSVDFGGDPTFERAKLNGRAVFSNAKLVSASFSKTTFPEKVYFDSSDLSLTKFKDVILRDSKVQWSGSTLDDVEFSNVSYKYRNLRGRCKGIKGSSSIWGDLLLRRDLQDQDYIDTLDTRLRVEKPKLSPWARAQEGADETLSTKFKRAGQNAVILGRNLATALDPKLNAQAWIVMLISALAVGVIVAAIVDQSVANWFGGMVGFSPGDDDRGWALLEPIVKATAISIAIAILVSSWFGKRAVFMLWGALGYGRDWDRVAGFAIILVIIFGFIYSGPMSADIEFNFAGDACAKDAAGDCRIHSHWFAPWFVAAMGFATLGISDVASPLTGAGQLLLLANVLAGFTIFGLLLAVLGNRFARRS